MKILVDFLICCFRLKVNKGVGIETIHYLNDGLWHLQAAR